MSTSGLHIILLLLITLGFGNGSGTPRITSFTREIVGPVNSSLVRNRDVILKCNIEGVASSFKIIKQHEEDKPLNSSHQSKPLTYLIRSVTCDDTGIYECVIDGNQRMSIGVMTLDCPPLPCQTNDMIITPKIYNESIRFRLCVLAYESLSSTTYINNASVKRVSRSSSWSWDYQKVKSNVNFINKFIIKVSHSNLTLVEYGELTFRVVSSVYVEYFLDLRVKLCPPSNASQRINQKSLDNHTETENRSLAAISTRNPEVLSTYLPPVVVVVFAVIVTALLSVRKVRMLRREISSRDTSMETIISNSASL